MDCLGLEFCVERLSDEEEMKMVKEWNDERRAWLMENTSTIIVDVLGELIRTLIGL